MHGTAFLLDAGSNSATKEIYLLRMKPGGWSCVHMTPVLYLTLLQSYPVQIFLPHVFQIYRFVVVYSYLLVSSTSALYTCGFGIRCLFAFLISYFSTSLFLRSLSHTTKTQVNASKNKRKKSADTNFR